MHKSKQLATDEVELDFECSPLPPHQVSLQLELDRKQIQSLNLNELNITRQKKVRIEREKKGRREEEA